MKKFITLLIFAGFPNIYPQVDTITYQWPDVPFDQSKVINGTFAEFRDTGTNDHFHNAVDIGEPDGNPIYACMDGIVQSIVTSAGSNSYVGTKSNINGQWKRLTYLHIVPNPSLYVGQSVKAGQTIMGTIYQGMGHVHLIERELVPNPDEYYAVEINNIRPDGGLKPYTDTYPPVIFENTVKFYRNNSSEELSADVLYDKVDIQVRVEDKNGTTYSGSNNGTYILGYRVWNKDTSEVVFEPFGNGIVYMFDRKPLESDVHKVFVKGKATLSDPVYWLTNGAGADVINSTQHVSDNYLDAAMLEEGKYVLEIFSEDTRSNKVNYFKEIGIATPPEPPALETVLNFDNRHSVKFEWAESTDSDLLGYRLYYSIDTQLNNWNLVADEKILGKSVTSYSINSPGEFQEPVSTPVYFFYLTAVDSSGTQSKPSDIYSRAPHNNGTDYPTALIVDGFDRFGNSGAWTSSTHKFNTSYFIPLFISDSIVISSSSDDAVAQGKVKLGDYDMVFWFVGDGGGPEKSFTLDQQLAVQDYLSGGGKIVVSGSEIGLDLGSSHSYSLENDSSFYRDYLKSKFVHNGLSSMETASGMESTVFSGLKMSFGKEFVQKYPDDFDPVDGAEILMTYNTNRTVDEPRIAAVGYKGLFGDGTLPGAVITIGFAVESVSDLNQRRIFMTKVLQYFGFITDVNDESERFPDNFNLSQNYPNPFNPVTTIEYTVSEKSESKMSDYNKVSLIVYDILGREVSVLVDEYQKPGKYRVLFNGKNLSSGIYFCILKTGTFKTARKMLLIK
ncbi:MAG: T9SS type A sorting domain-containing protein [Melioribacteraceae bacterium]|nr:T9SS type A sorting domain-containing protein [Melioribacteraceae bacterium]